MDENAEVQRDYESFAYGHLGRRYKKSKIYER